MDYEKAMETWEERENGNISFYNAKVRRMSKIEMLDMIEALSGQCVPRHVVINTMRTALE